YVRFFVYSVLPNGQWLLNFIIKLTLYYESAARELDGSDLSLYFLDIINGFVVKLSEQGWLAKCNKHTPESSYSLFS
ncbi:hypothetical protein J4G08_16150, partial [Candidatus Poribacteria bacterium]|nr:hypothetical protein [Candidatus Poribacteria bacterium]